MSEETPKFEDEKAAILEQEPAAAPLAHKHGHGHLPHLPSRLLEKLKRRNVGRVAVLYVVVCYVILEPFEMFFHLLELPAWTGRTVVFLMVLGFPAALLFAWIYEVTPTGIKPSVDVDSRQSIASRTGRKLDRAIIAVLAVALAYFIVDKFWISKHVAEKKPLTEVKSVAEVKPATEVPAVSGHAASTAPMVIEKSVAVLPFVDMSEKKDQEYFSDGLAEELIDHLAHADDLKVIARTSSFQFKGKNEDMRTIGQRLGVANLLEGSVRTAGNTFRITAQLINVIDGTHRWSETYDRKMGDIFKVQDEIAGAVVAALKATMTAPPMRLVQSSNIDSYNEILRGRYFRERTTREDSERSIEALRRAIAIDPNNATAWAELGAAYHSRGLYGWMPPKAAYAESRRAVDKALALNPNEARAHMVLGVIMRGYLHEGEAAKAHIRRAFELDPKLKADSLNDAIEALANGQSEVALAEFQRHAELNPLDPYTLSWLVGSLLDANRLPEAERAARNILEINPNYADAHCTLGYVLIEERKFDAALATMNEELGENSRLVCVADALWALSRHAEAQASIAQAEAKYADSEAYGIAGYYARRGDADKVFKWLDRAYENQEPPVQLIKGDSDFKKYQEDPRFGTLLKKVKGP
jgi:adenylate cyclase